MYEPTDTAFGWYEQKVIIGKSYKKYEQIKLDNCELEMILWY